MPSLNLYLAKLQACLGDLPSGVQRDVIEELRGHLEDRASSLQLPGISKEASISEAIERFGEAGEVAAALRDVHGRMSWAKVGLAVLPGLFAISTFWLAWRTGRLDAVGLGMCVLLGIAGFIRERQLPVWAFAALGVLFGSINSDFVPVILVGPLWLLATIVALVVCRRRGIHIPAFVWVFLSLMIAVGVVKTVVRTANDGFWWGTPIFSHAPTGAVLLSVAVGLLLARRSGVLAGLFVVATGSGLVDGAIDPFYGVGKSPWGIVMNVILAGSLLVVSPIWVLRSRSKRGQVWGLLLPAFIGLTSVVAINAILRADPAILERIVNFRVMFPGDRFVYGMSGGLSGRDNLVYLLISYGLAAAQLFMGMTLAVVLYHWVESQWTSPDEEAIDQKLNDVLLARGT
jgi:hypothetical protein